VMLESRRRHLEAYVQVTNNTVCMYVCMYVYA
jgi:hypothetical protein